MSQLDFIVSIALVVTMISMVIFFSASDFSSKASYINSYIIDEDSDSLNSYLFSNAGVLTDEIKDIQIKLIETGNYSHEEKITLSLKGDYENIYLYDSSMNQINFNSENKDIVFSISFDPQESKYFDIFFKGEINNIKHSARNISAIILSEKNISVIRPEKCSDLDYNSTVDIFGYFRIEFGDCVVGLDPPETGDIIVSEYPLLLFDEKGPRSDIVKISVW